MCSSDLGELNLLVDIYFYLIEIVLMMPELTLAELSKRATLSLAEFKNKKEVYNLDSLEDIPKPYCAMISRGRGKVMGVFNLPEISL